MFGEGGSSFSFAFFYSVFNLIGSFFAGGGTGLVDFFFLSG